MSQEAKHSTLAKPMPTEVLEKEFFSPPAEKKPAKLNCWEFLHCGREPGGKRAQEICDCPAAVFSAIPDGHYNSGTCMGRRCWRIAGTLCGGNVQGTFANKIEDCRQCLFYLKVKAEEMDNFVE